MLKIFIVMICAMVLGFSLRHRQLPRQGLSRAISGVILTMMSLIGIEMGSSQNVIQAVGTIFTDAALITVGALGGTILLAWLFNKLIIKAKVDKDVYELASSGHSFSLLIISVFGIGVLVGYVSGIGHYLVNFSMWALYLLMALVGFSLGSDKAAIAAMRAQNWKVIFLPIATIIGTLGGILLISPLLDMSITEQLAVGSGFGYYSLSSVLLSELAGAQIGAVALIVNVMRELVTVMAAPLIVRYFSPVALICSGGATTIDVTLPIIVNNCGTSFVAMAIFQGVVVDFSVPFLVTFFATI